MADERKVRAEVISVEEDGDDGYSIILTADVRGFRGGVRIFTVAGDEEVRKLMLKICDKINAPDIEGIIREMKQTYEKERDKAEKELRQVLLQGYVNACEEILSQIDKAKKG